MYHPSPQSLGRPEPYVDQGIDRQPASAEGPSGGPSGSTAPRRRSLVPAVLVTAMTLGALLWAVPDANDERQPQDPSVTIDPSIGARRVPDAGCRCA